MKRYVSLFESNKIVLWDSLSTEEKAKRIIKNPYDKNKYYHVTEKDNLKSILSKGISGEEIWVSKGKPVYSDGIAFELDLKNINLKPDERWKKSDEVYVALETIPPKTITKVFSWIEGIKLREDELALQFEDAEIEEAIEFIEDEKI